MKTRADRGTSVESRGRRSSHAESLLPGGRRSHTGERPAASSLDGGGGDAAEFGTARDAARDRWARLMNSPREAQSLNMSHGLKYSGGSFSDLITISGMSSPQASLHDANSMRHQPRLRHEVKSQI